MPHHFCQAICLTVFLASVALAVEATTFSFEEDAEGSLPAGWMAAKTGEGAGSVWKVVVYEMAGKMARALAQTSAEGPNSLFNVCVARDTRAVDIDVSVRLKAVSGVNDRGGGLVWRYRDADNYYIARWNPLEDNFRVYHVLNGQRTQLATADIKLPPTEWHTVRAVQRGNHIQCYLDGSLLLDVMDGTLTAAGAIGLWTKADAVTWFDDLSVNVLARE